MIPVTHKEYFLAAMTGEDVELPSPVDREEIYLAILCGESIDIPIPVTVDEMYLAALCGMDIAPPPPVTRLQMIWAGILGEIEQEIVPVTREEYYWLNYEGGTEIVTVTGVSPLLLPYAAAKPIKSLIQYGKCETDNGDIYCNNGALKMADDELPSGYRRLLGITYDGNFRYETGEYLTGNDDVTMTLDNLSSSGKNVFGSYNGASQKNFSLYIYGSTSGSYFRFGDQLTRPKYGSTGKRTITFGAGGTSGFSDDTSVDPDTFTTPDNVYIGMLPNSSSPGYTGDIIGNILVGTRLKWIPVERESDGVIGYYERVNSNFIAPTGSGTPVSLGYDTSHLNVLSVVGTPEVLTIGNQTASVENLFEVNGVADEQDIISGVITRKVGVNVSAGVITLSPLATPVTEHVTPQPLSTVEGSNTLSWTAEVSGTTKTVAYAYVAPVEPSIINMFDFFWANGNITLSSQVTSDATIETKYLLVSGEKDATALTVESKSPLTIANLYTNSIAGVLEYNDGSVDLVSLLVSGGSLTVYPPLKADVSSGKIYSLAYSIHLSSAGYRYYTDCFYRMNRKYTRKGKAIAQYNPQDWANAGTNPLTKIGSFWWGRGQENVVNESRRVIEHGTVDYLNMSFVTGATAQSPKGFEWSQNLNGETGYFEMYIGGRDTEAQAAELAEGLEFTIEWYLDGVLAETKVKKTKRFEPIRFDFSGAQTGKVRMTVTSGAATFAAFLSQATWWVTGESDGAVFDPRKVPLLFMDSWGTYHDKATELELADLLAASGGSGRVINNSQGSATSAWGVANFAGKVLAESPDYMVSDFQINDINTSVSVGDYIDNMKSLMASAISGGIVPIILLSAHNTSVGNYSKYTFPLIAALAELPAP